MNIFLACYIEYDLGYNKKKNGVENVVNNYFQETSSLIAEERNPDNTVTLVFRIQSPIKSLNDFFLSLETVFSILSEYKIHFTQENHYHSISTMGNK